MKTLYIDKIVDIEFSAHDAFLEKPSQDTFNAKILGKHISQKSLRVRTPKEVVLSYYRVRTPTEVVLSYYRVRTPTEVVLSYYRIRKPKEVVLSYYRIRIL